MTTATPATPTPAAANTRFVSGSLYSQQTPLHIEPRLRRIELIFIWGLWGCIAVLTAINTLLNPVPSVAGIPSQPITPIIGSLSEALLWALITPIIFWLTRRYSLDHPHWLLRLLLFVALGIAVSTCVYRLMNFIRHEESLLYSYLTGKPQVLPPYADPSFVQQLWILFEFAVFLVILAAGIAKDYLVRYRTYQTRYMHLNVELANARLSALQAQLNPHFLFNTLNGVSSLIQRDPERAQDMLASLSSLLRSTLERTELEVPLEQELQFINHYLDMMRTRFQDRLETTANIDPDTLHAMVPNLILQPLVENAIKHGVEKLEGIGRIEIRARRQGETLILSVLDNGDIASSERMQADDNTQSMGMGLSNTCARLAQSYGKQQSLSLHSNPAGGVIAEIKLPFHATPISGLLVP